MQRNSGIGSNSNSSNSSSSISRAPLPIFGCRKRQRQGIFADTIDFPSSHDDSLFVDDDMLDDKGQGYPGNQVMGGNALNQNMLPDERPPTRYSQTPAAYNKSNNNIQRQSNYPQKQSSFNSNLPSHYNNSSRNHNNFGSKMGNSSSTYDQTSVSNTQQNCNMSYYDDSSRSHKMNQSSIQQHTSSSNFSKVNSKSSQRLHQQKPSFGLIDRTNNPCGNSFGEMNLNVIQSRKTSGGFGRNGSTGESSQHLGMVSPPKKNYRFPSSTQPSRTFQNNQQLGQRFVNRTFSGKENCFGPKNAHRQQPMDISSNQTDAVVPQQKMNISPAKPAAQPSFKMKKKQTPAAAKMVTTTIQGLQRWSRFTTQSPILFEVCGVLSSTISYHSVTPQKVFTLNDGCADMKCVFWEIDRRLPHLARGSTIRCVGKLNAEFFQCLCVRNIKPREMQLFHDLVVRSDAELTKLISTDAREKN